MRKIYLASKSPRRKELLRQAGIAFELLPLRMHPLERRDVDETPLADEAAQDYVLRIARLKAEAAMRIMVTRRLAHRLVLAADTTVVLNGAILGKPEDARDAAAMLTRLSGQTHEVLTAIAVANTEKVESALSRSEVTFRKLDEAEIRQYVESGEPLDKAGAYAIQGGAAIFVAHLSGSYSGVMGLPLFETAQLIKEFEAQSP
jgi:nucleoside triphosphate pyrophosphatase